MSKSTENPHLKQIERAPYELGYLLQSVPADFSPFKPQTPETYLMAEAVVTHASNANEALLSGLEALGGILFVVSANNDFGVEKHQLANLGCLIKHLAVEAQFMQETIWSYEHSLRERVSAKK